MWTGNTLWTLNCQSALMHSIINLFCDRKGGSTRILTVLYIQWLNQVIIWINQVRYWCLLYIVQLNDKNHHLSKQRYTCQSAVFDDILIKVVLFWVLTNQKHCIVWYIYNTHKMNNCKTQTNKCVHWFPGANLYWNSYWYITIYNEVFYKP